MCLQLTQLYCDDRENVLYLIIIQSEVCMFNHCLGLGHGTVVCNLSVMMFLCIDIPGANYRSGSYVLIYRVQITDQVLCIDIPMFLWIDIPCANYRSCSYVLIYRVQITDHVLMY